MNSASNGAAPVNDTSAAGTYVYLLKRGRGDRIEIGLTVELRIDVDSVPDHRRVLGRCSAKRRRGHHAVAVFLKVDRGIEFEQRRKIVTICFQNRIGQ